MAGDLSNSEELFNETQIGMLHDADLLQPSNLEFSGFKIDCLDLSIGVAIPAFNEEKNIGDVLTQLTGLGLDNILVIDGLSADGTLKVAEKNGAKIVLQDGRGKGQAIRQVLKNEYLDSDVLVLMDADGSMSPEEVPRFVAAIKDGADVVKGSRFISGGKTYDMTFLRRFGNTIMTSFVNFVCSSNYTDLCYGFVALNKKAVRALAPVLETNGFEIETEVFIKAKKLGLKVVEVPSIEYERKSGKSNLKTFRDGYKILKTIAIASLT
ncbi:MAG: glycosyltransferase family 2 protein [Candidatus Bathyarchaeota archaeon]|nr:glycosyltransferase family 2 protein [Candidatus Bathyarchaeota archaeon]